MTPNPDRSHAGAAYAALRFGGTPPLAARLQLGLAPAVARRLEQMFQSRAAQGRGDMRPKFARHAGHVAAVRAAGGYPVLACRK